METNVCICNGQFSILNKDFYIRDTLVVAQELIGKYIIRLWENNVIAGRIIETEAYIGRIDKACHAYNYKRTKRTDIIFSAGGVAYVYFIYGMYYCMNVVTEAEGEPAAVLIRGVDITQGVNLASQFRYGQDYSQLSRAKQLNISNGPGKLCAAFNITKEQNGVALDKGSLLIAEEVSKASSFNIERTKRIGIDYAEEAVDFPWRFVLK